MEVGWGSQQAKLLRSFLEPEASCVSSGSCLYRAGQPHLASVAGSLGGLNLGHEKDGSYHAPPSSQLPGLPSHLDCHSLPVPHLGLPAVTPEERCPREGRSAAHIRHVGLHLCPESWSPPSQPSSPPSPPGHGGTGKSPQARRQDAKGLTLYPHGPLFPSLDNGEFEWSRLFLSSLLPFFLPKLRGEIPVTLVQAQARLSQLPEQALQRPDSAGKVCLHQHQLLQGSLCRSLSSAPHLGPSALTQLGWLWGPGR